MQLCDSQTVPLRTRCFVAVANFPVPNRNKLTNQKNSQQRDLYLDKQVRYPMVTSDQVCVYAIFGYD